jgi:hypothetical protein
MEEKMARPALEFFDTEREVLEDDTILLMMLSGPLDYNEVDEGAKR